MAALAKNGLVPKNKKKRPTPMMQAARKIVSLFDTGEFFTNEHVEKARSEVCARVRAAQTVNKNR